MVVYKYLKKTAVLVVGVIILIIGAALLVLPGPGLLTIALGLLILSSEFTWAERHLQSVKLRLKQVIDTSKERVDKLSKK